MIKNVLPVKGDKKRSMVIFDDGEAVCVLASAVKEFKLEENAELTVERVKEISRAAEERLAFSKAADALSRSMKSQKEMKQYLKDKGFKREVALTVTDKLAGYGYIDDKAYLDAYVSRYGGNTGRKKLVYDLTALKGIESAAAEEYVYGAFDDGAEREKAARVLEQFLKRSQKKANLKQKAYTHLKNKGFESDIALWAVSNISEED